MSIKIGFVMDPIESITVKKDTTLAMMLAAQKRGWQLYYLQAKDLYLDQGQARATVTTITVQDDRDHWFDYGVASDIALAELDTVLMRKDPPFDTNYVYATYLLEQAARDGCLVVNNPQSLRDCNEKLFATQFPQCCPPVKVSCNAEILKSFHAEHGDVIFKPLDGMGGASIFRVKPDDPNVNVILEILTGEGEIQIMAQKYIPEIVNGDKRILLIEGKPVPYCLARIPAAGETRGNLAAGGNGVSQELTDRDRWICEQVSPTLIEKELLFVGLDVIGDYLTEINVTSPTCIREIDSQQGLDIAGDLMECISKKLEP